MKISQIVHNVHIRHITGVKSLNSILWIFTFKSDHLKHGATREGGAGGKLNHPDPPEGDKGVKGGFLSFKRSPVSVPTLLTLTSEF